MSALALRLPGQQIAASYIQASMFPDRATAQTVGKMTGIIRASCYHPLVVKAAREAIGSKGGSNPATSPREKAEAIFKWVKANLTFCQDEVQLRELFGKQDALELLIEPPLMLSAERPTGDCDDYTKIGRASCRERV